MKQIHQKLSFQKAILPITAFAISLTSCGSPTAIPPEEEPLQPDTSYANEENTQFAQITHLDTKPKPEKNKLLYGKLQITLPDNVTIEEQKPENDTRVIDFIGMEQIKDKPLPPRIWLAHYHAVYKNEYDLTSALFDVLPDAQLSRPLRIRYKTPDNRHYLFTFGKDFNKQGYVLVHEDDLYILEELETEQDYSLQHLFDNNAVRWEDDTCAIGDRRSEKYNTIYHKVNAEEYYSFLAVQSAEKNNVRTVFLFQDGYFTEPDSIFSFEEVSGTIDFEDYNFDGCPDMIVPSPYLVWLWNPDRKAYEETAMPEGFRPSVGSIKCFPETKTIYRKEYDDEKNKEENWDMYYRTESLWQWEEQVLTKKRECIVEKSDEDVRISAYENNAQSQNVLFDKTVSITDWEENNINVQECYQTFYAGMLPEKNNDWLHPIDYNPEHKEYIPQAFLDEFTNAIRNNTVPETREKYMIDNQLTSDGMAAVSKNNIELRCDFLSGVWIKNYTMTMTDADNDGIEDIIVEKYYGNAKNFTDYVFFQGQKDGTYQKTSSYSSVKERFDVLCYDGKNYLCHTPLGYDSEKSVSLVCYVDGVAVETVVLK